MLPYAGIRWGEKLMVKKILILGDADSDKNMVLNYISDKTVQISVLNYKKIIIDDKKHYIINMSGNSELKTLKEVLTDQVNGIIFFFDSRQGINEDDLELIELIAKNDIPHIIFANKTELFDINLEINLKDVLIIPTMVREGIGVADGLKMLLKLIDMAEENLIEHVEEEPVDNPYDIAETKGSAFCKLSLSFHPIELENVKASLEKFGFSNLTLVETNYVQKLDKKETYRGSSYQLTLPPKMEINMVVKREDISYVINAMENIKNEDISENILIYPVEEVIRIRTREKGVRAVD